MTKAVKQPSLSDRVVALIETAKRKVGTAVNLAQVYTNYEIGRQIVEEEQKGRKRAEYGEKILIELSSRLTARFGRGWSAESLRKMRAFFMMYSEIHNTVVEIPSNAESRFVSGACEVPEEGRKPVALVHEFTLSWSHYLLLMRIKDPVERAFYEREATEGG